MGTSPEMVLWQALMRKLKWDVWGCLLRELPNSESLMFILFHVLIISPSWIAFFVLVLKASCMWWRDPSHNTWWRTTYVWIFSETFWSQLVCVGNQVVCWDSVVSHQEKIGGVFSEEGNAEGLCTGDGKIHWGGSHTENGVTYQCRASLAYALSWLPEHWQLELDLGSAYSVWNMTNSRQGGKN